MRKLLLLGMFVCGGISLCGMDDLVYIEKEIEAITHGFEEERVAKIQSFLSDNIFKDKYRNYQAYFIKAIYKHYPDLFYANLVWDYEFIAAIIEDEGSFLLLKAILDYNPPISLKSWRNLLSLTSQESTIDEEKHKLLVNHVEKVSCERELQPLDNKAKRKHICCDRKTRNCILLAFSASLVIMGKFAYEVYKIKKIFENFRLFPWDRW